MEVPDEEAHLADTIDKKLTSINVKTIVNHWVEYNGSGVKFEHYVWIPIYGIGVWQQSVGQPCKCSVVISCPGGGRNNLESFVEVSADRKHLRVVGNLQK